MKVQMTTTAAGPAGVWPAGAVVDVDASTAGALVDGGYAVPLDPSADAVPGEPEAAQPGPTEPEEAPRPRRRRGVGDG